MCKKRALRLSASRVYSNFFSFYCCLFFFVKITHFVIVSGDCETEMFSSFRLYTQFFFYIGSKYIIKNKKMNNRHALLQNRKNKIMNDTTLVCLRKIYSIDVWEHNEHEKFSLSIQSGRSKKRKDSNIYTHSY